MPSALSPTLTLITVTFNAEAVLARTLRSVAAQPTDDYEYIIVDGASTDGTLALVETYKRYVSTLISEPDRGLYDAMNKGLAATTGEYVWFMNAGDELYDATTLPRLLAEIERSHADVYYSDTLFVRDDGSAVGLRSAVTPHALPETLRWPDFATGMKVGHQAFVVRRALAPRYVVNNLSADIDWEIRCLKAAKTVQRLPFVLCRYLVGGLSKQKHRQSLTDRFRVLTWHFGLGATFLNHSRILWRALEQRFRQRV